MRIESLPSGQRLLHWGPSPQEARAGILAIHGMGAEPEDFAPLGEYLAKRQIALLAPDLRGNGRDRRSADRGHFFDPDIWFTDLQKIAAEKMPKTWFLAGDSMGSMLAAVAAAENIFRPAPAGLILLAPVVELKEPVSPRTLRLLRFGAALFPRLRLPPSLFVTGKRKLPPLSRDPERQNYVRSAAYRIPIFTLRFLRDLGALMERALLSGNRIPLPTLTLIAGQDIFIHAQQSLAWALQNTTSGSRILYLPEAYHQILHDWNRETALQVLDEWLEERCFETPS